MPKLAVEEVQETQLVMFDYASIEGGADIQNTTQQIVMLWSQSIEAIRQVGIHLNEVKQRLHRSQFMKWIDVELSPIGLSYDRAISAMNFAKEYKRVEGTPKEDALKLMASQDMLSIIYRISSEKTPEALRDSVYEMVLDGEKPERKKIEELKKMWRTHNLQEAGGNLSAEAGSLLVQTEIAEDKDQLQRISKLSKRKQLMVAKSIASGSASSTREALRQIKEEPEESIIDVDSVESVEVAQVETVLTLKGRWQTAIRKVASESVNIALVEAPNSFEWVQTEYANLLKALGPTLALGGFAIISMGQKAITATYDVTEANGLHVLQPLVLRLQPGRTSTIVGINVMTASRLALVVYKSPYRQPKGMLVDLQTVGESTDAQDSVESGIEAGFVKFLTQLGHADDTLLHLQIDAKKSFNMREALIKGTKPFVKQFIAIG
jgi:hypothetical protein